MTSVSFNIRKLYIGLSTQLENQNTEHQTLPGGTAQH